MVPYLNLVHLEGLDGGQLENFKWKAPFFIAHSAFVTYLNLLNLGGLDGGQLKNFKWKAPFFIARLAFSNENTQLLFRMLYFLSLRFIIYLLYLKENIFFKNYGGLNNASSVYGLVVYDNNDNEIHRDNYGHHDRDGHHRHKVAVML